MDYENTWSFRHQHRLLVRHAEPVDRPDHRTGRRVAVQSTEQLGGRRYKMSEEKIMNRTIEANFFPQDVEPIKEKASILVIDNNRDFTHSAKLALEATGRYVVGEENDGRKAHQIAQSFRPDLILLDIAMPEIDGGDVAAQIQADPALHRIPIVFLTALVTKSEGEPGLRIHGHPFLAKPISLPELIEGIEENLPARATL